MFICQSCHDKSACQQGFVEGMMRSRGPCEQCGKVDNCLDCHGYKYLPLPAEEQAELDRALAEDSRIDPNPGGEESALRWAKYSAADKPSVRFLDGTGDAVTCNAFLSMHHPIRRKTGHLHCTALIPVSDLPGPCPACGQWRSA